MRLITLNTWGGRAGREKLLAFFEKYKDSADVFCLQEIWSAPYEHYQGHDAGSLKIDHSQIMTDGLQEITRILPDFKPFFYPLVGDNYGLLILTKDNMPVLDNGERYVYKHKEYISEENIGDHGRPIQFVTLELDSGPLTIINFHGAWIKGKNKTDTKDRINQSKKIVEFTQSLPNNLILCGDFNILPETKSMAIIEKTGLRNLIKDHNITSTRTSFYPGQKRFADYIFIPQNIEIKNFKVLPEEVSDHSALFLDIKI